jgi:O-antigen ligase
MVTSVLILAHIILKYRKRVSKSKLLLLILAFIPLVTLNINTGSRLSFVSLFLGLSLVFVLFRSGGLLSKIITLSVGLVATILLFDLAMKSETLGIRLSKTFEEGNIAGRDEIWLSILPLIENNWIAGVGRTGYLEYVSHMYGVIISPHNVIIEIFAYSGIIGFVLFFGFISKIFYNAYRFFKKSNEVIPFVFIVPISGIILTAQILNFKLCWVIFAYAASRKLYLKSIST